MDAGKDPQPEIETILDYDPNPKYYRNKMFLNYIMDLKKKIFQKSLILQYICLEKGAKEF